MTTSGHIPPKYDASVLQRVFDNIDRALRLTYNTNQDVHIIENRLILQSPNGTYYEITVDNAGTLGTTSLGTSL
jgi:hypothetical protein